MVLCIAGLVLVFPFPASISSISSSIAVSVIGLHASGWSLPEFTGGWPASTGGLPVIGWISPFTVLSLFESGGLPAFG